MVRRSFALAFADRAVVIGTGIGAMAVLSRLLTPAEIGLFVVASVVVVLIEGLRDFGIGAFLVSEPDLTDALRRTAVTLIAILSLTLGAGTVLVAPHLADFYGDAALTPLIRVAAIGFLLAPVGTPLMALLRREMRFGAVATVNVAAGVASAGASITLAASGVGPMSLVVGTVVAAAVTATGAACLHRDRTVFWPCLAGWRRVLRFGAWSSVVTVLGMFLDALPRLVLGRVLGFGAVGFYARAISVSQLPERLVLSAVQPVLLPALSAETRRGGALGGALMMGMSYVSGLQWPALAMIALLAHPIVVILLGQQWTEVVPLVRISAPAMAFLVPVYLCYPTLVALGRIRDMALAMAILVVPSLVIVLVCAPLGLRAMALALAATSGLQAVVLLTALRRRVAFGIGDLARRLGVSAGVTVVTVALPAAIVLGAGPAPGMVATGFAVVSGAAGWVVGVICLDHPLRTELRAVRRAITAWRGNSAIRPSG